MTSGPIGVLQMSAIGIRHISVLTLPVRFHLSAKFFRKGYAYQVLQVNVGNHPEPNVLIAWASLLGCNLPPPSLVLNSYLGMMHVRRD